MAVTLSIARMKPVSRELAGINKQLKRVADYFEIYLAQVHGCHVERHEPDTSGEEAVALYTDEEADFVREWMENTGKAARPEEE